MYDFLKHIVLPCTVMGTNECIKICYADLRINVKILYLFSLYNYFNKPRANDGQ